MPDRVASTNHGRNFDSESITISDFCVSPTSPKPSLHRSCAQRFLRLPVTTPMTLRESIDIAVAANKLLGFNSLLPGQRQVIQALLEGHDALLVQPEGPGRSAVFQVAGALLE